MENDDTIAPPGECAGTMTYAGLLERWQGECDYPDGGKLLIWVTMTTFLNYLDEYLAQRLGGKAPTDEERRVGIAHCRQLSYWRTLAVETRDPEIHVRRFGRQGSEEAPDGKSE